MKLLKRISQLISANINHMLDQAEDPEVMVKQIIREMEESIIELRRETVRAVAREKQLQRQIQAAGDLSCDLEEKAKLALQKGEAELAREAVTRKIQTQRMAGTLDDELHGAGSIAVQLRADLVRLEDQVQVARRKRDELIRRKRAAEAQRRTQEAARRSAQALNTAAMSVSELASSGSAFDSYAEDVTRLEAEAEAEREVLHREIEKELDLQKLADEHAVEEELERLRKTVLPS